MQPDNFEIGMMIQQRKKSSKTGLEMKQLYTFELPALKFV